MCVVAAGGDLFENVLRDGHYSERRASVAIEQLMQALQAVHERGVVHRCVGHTGRGVAGAGHMLAHPLVWW
jgi:ferritin-like metal-binding protein YciE